jgi:site-specific recombinase XerD
MSAKTCPFLLSDDEFGTLCLDFITGRPQVRTAKSRQEYRLAPWAFRRWMLSAGHADLEEGTVKAWLLHRVSKASVLNVTIQANILVHFVDFLVVRGLCMCNPFRSLKRQHRTQRMRGIVRCLAEMRSISALDARADEPFSGPLGPYFQQYLGHLRALGVTGVAHEVYLASLERFLRRRAVTDLNAIDYTVIEQWSRWQGDTTEHNQRYRMLILAKFFDFLVGHRVIEGSPVPRLMPHRRRSLPPHIYSRTEVARILELAGSLHEHRLLPHRGPTYRTFFLTLYTLGLRCNEALALRLNDIDFTRRTLTIREGKFRKGRVLPFGPRYGVALQRYIEANPLLQAAAPAAFLFPTHDSRTTRLSPGTVREALAMILGELAIVARAETRPPGLHSFRHSFAVHRIERWHREGADLGVKLPLLSAFLGHTELASTQIYLTMTPERLQLVGDAFERVFGRTAAEEHYARKA